MSSKRFSDETLSLTLAAVQARRRRRQYRRGLTVLGLLVTVVVTSRWSSLPEAESLVRSGERIQTIKEWQTDPTVDSSPAIQVFTTEDMEPKVIQLDNDGLERLLEGRAYGTYVAADGDLRFWMPGS